MRARLWPRSCAPSSRQRAVESRSLSVRGLEALDVGELHRIARLYWYTVEFGLALEDGELRIYGAGILSSFGESRYSLESAKPHRLKFDLNRVLRTRYRADAFQQSYFVIDRIEDALASIQQNDFSKLYAEVGNMRDVDPAVADEAEQLAA